MSRSAPGFLRCQAANTNGEIGISKYDLASESCFWTSKDPIRFDGGDTNIYAYVANDPINMTDPTGKLPTDTHGVTICDILPWLCAITRGLPPNPGDPGAGGAMVFPHGDTGGSNFRDPQICPGDCPPCDPPGPGFSRTDTTHSHWPCPGAHTHVYNIESHQNPQTCECFEKRVEVELICH